MSLPRYPQYRESGIEWLGEVPAHWESVRLGSLFRETDDIGSDELPVLRVSIHDGVSDREFNEDEQDRKVTRSEDRTKYKRVQPGDLVYNMMRAWQGGFGSVTVLGMVSPAYVVARPLAKIRTEFIEQLLRTPQAVEELRRHSQGVTDFRLRLYWDEFKSIKIALPTAEEQGEILDQLGPETAKIDALILEQQRLIELLTEKRQAVISRAVTKSLNPAAPTKDSGIEWLGKVPAHWAVARLKHELAFLTSGSRGWADYYSDEGALFIRIGNLTRESIRLDLSDIQRVSVPDGSEGERTRVQAGDLLFSITAYLGSVAVVPKGLEPAYVSQHVALARLRPARLLPEWAAYVTLSVVGKTYFDIQGYGGTKVQLSLDDVASLLMTLPSSDEQREIVRFLNEETEKMDKLITESLAAVALLQERRTALISAAVTGKIDVRHLPKTTKDKEIAA